MKFRRKKETSQKEQKESNYEILKEKGNITERTERK